MECQELYHGYRLPSGNLSTGLSVIFVPAIGNPESLNGVCASISRRVVVLRSPQTKEAIPFHCRVLASPFFLCVRSLCSHGPLVSVPFDLFDGISVAFVGTSTNVPCSEWGNDDGGEGQATSRPFTTTSSNWKDSPDALIRALRSSTYGLRSTMEAT